MSSVTGTRMAPTWWHFGQGIRISGSDILAGALVFDAWDAATVSGFGRLACRQSIELRLDLPDARPLRLEFLDNLRDLGSEAVEVAVGGWSGRAGGASFSA